jgi:uncharacterized protein (DUF302 family)
VIADNGIVSKLGRNTVDQVVEKLKALLREKSITLFALIDHSGEAAKAGLRMRPAKLLIFGNPKAGTPLMLAAPTTALDLPLKILVWEDEGGQVWLTYDAPAYLQQRHNFPKELLPNIAAVEMLAARAAE